MLPLAQYDLVWARCGQLSIMHAYLAGQVTPVVTADEILRAEWVMRVSALDMYVHELVAQNMVGTFEGRRPPSPGYLRFQLTNETVQRIRNAASATDASAAFDLEVRERLRILSFQQPDKIADGVRLFSAVELWDSVAAHVSASSGVSVDAKSIKNELSLVVRRRNQLAHEGDLQPGSQGVPWPISQADLATVAQVVDRVVRGIDAVV
jgi:hypothetical protein